MTHHTIHQSADERFNPVAGVLAYLLPGLGHWYLGEAKRGLLIGAGVLWLFFGAVLIGGIDSVDRVEDKWWFVGQAGVGPIAFAADLVHQTQFKVVDSRGQLQTPPPGPDAKASKSIGHANEIGSLFGAIAGMLNIMCVIDALWRPRIDRRVRIRSASASDGAPA